MVYYVYFLIDPTTDEIFYVGKGSNYRDFSHLKPSLWSNPKCTPNPFLYYKIKSLMEKDTPPIIKRVADNISEDDAYNLENFYILKYGRRFVDGGILFNISDLKGGSIGGRSKPWSSERKCSYQKMCRNKRLYDPSFDELFEDYISKGFHRKTIAKMYGVSESLVKIRLKELGIIKPKNLCYPPRNVFVCEKCGKEFTSSHSVKKRKYCSNICKRK